MQITAAVLRETGQPLELLQLETPALKEGQVLVEVAYSGVCHTQLLECDGARGEDRFLPHCLGHEGSGKVLEVGPGVTKCATGDHVVMSWIAGSGINAGGTTYNEVNNGRTVNAGPVTTFSTHAVVSENRLTKIPPGFPLDQAAFLGCAVPTGLGSVIHTAKVQEGASCVIWGLGGVGLSALMGAVLVKADPIVAVDLSDERLAAAQKMGATICLKADEVDVEQELKKRFPVGVDFSFEATGNAQVMAEAIGSTRPQGGTTVIIGNAPHGARIKLDPFQFNLGKRVFGSWGGDAQPERDIPFFCRLANQGQLDLAPLRSSSYRLEEINLALEDLRQKKVVRPLIDMHLHTTVPHEQETDFSI